MDDRMTTGIRFLTPAFLGDAEGKGRWRTPPFKALLREWWRIAAAKAHGYDWRRLREAEGELFGHAFLKHNDHTWASRSRVRIRLSEWRPGALSNWNVNVTPVQHREVQRQGGRIDPLLYLGYGPLTFRGRTTLTREPAIAAGETAELEIWPLDAVLKATLELIHAFGTLGGRCRNGWGSIALERQRGTSLEDMRKLAERHARPLEACLQQDWPHAFGKDHRGLLCWRTKQTYHLWEEALRELADVKIKFRTNLTWKHNPTKLDDRHILAYPVTNHKVANLSQERLANQLRFKVVQDGSRFRGLAYHLPHKVPATPKTGSLYSKFSSHDRSQVLARQRQIWQRVHGVLDREMTRL